MTQIILLPQSSASSVLCLPCGNHRQRKILPRRLFCLQCRPALTLRWLFFWCKLSHREKSGCHSGNASISQLSSCSLVQLCITVSFICYPLKYTLLNTHYSKSPQHPVQYPLLNTHYSKLRMRHLTRYLPGHGS